MKIIRFSFKLYWNLFPIVRSSLKLRITVRGGIVDALVSMKHQIICNHDDDSVVTGIIGTIYDDVIKWKHFPRYLAFVREIHRSPVNSPHKGHWRGALMFSLICVWINGWVNNREAGDLRRYRAHYDVSVMITFQVTAIKKNNVRKRSTCRWLVVGGLVLSQWQRAMSVTFEVPQVGVTKPMA